VRVSIAADAAPSPQPAGRFALVDGLRGGASLAVAVFHFWNNPAFAVARDATPALIRHLFEGGRLGVEVFFAISGFVMAYTLRNAVVTPLYAAAFVLRRSLRLDPPYWTTLALALLAAASSDLLTHRGASTMPPLPVVLAHVVYLQDLFQYPPILLTFWTLCLEVQFYLVLLGFVWLSARVSRSAYYGLHALLGAFSVASYAGVVPAIPGLFPTYWFMFLAGSLVAWAALGRIPVWIPFGMGAGSVILGAGLRNPEPIISGVATGVLALGAWRPSFMGALRAKPIQWLGRISYSLYLVHPLVGERLQNVGHRIHGDRVGWCWFWLAVATAVTLAIAAIFYRLVEAPCVALARRVSEPWLARAAERRLAATGTQ
jgi:peptidoglycan/LPS O-acetylase OafA/YrhL